MFETYNEKARRTVFFARYEASVFGSRRIGPEHVLLGILREDRGLAWRVLPKTPTENIREELGAAMPRGESIPTNIDLPISEECKAVFDFADKEAERMQESQIAPEHLLLGILSQEKCQAARILARHGLTLDGVRSLISSEKLRDVRNVMRAETDVAVKVGWREPRVPKHPQIEFKAEGTDHSLGIAYAGYIPQAGQEIIIGEGRARVVRVVHYYQEGLVVGEWEHQRIVVSLEILKE